MLDTCHWSAVTGSVFLDVHACKSRFSHRDDKIFVGFNVISSFRFSAPTSPHATLALAKVTRSRGKNGQRPASKTPYHTVIQIGYEAYDGVG